MKKGWLIAAFIVFFVLLAGVVYVWHLYDKTDFNVFYQGESTYDYNGLLLLEKDGSSAMCYRPLLRSFEETELIETDLSAFGFEGEKARFFLLDGIAVSPDAKYEGFYPVSSKEKFIYLTDGGKYVIDLIKNRSYPMFSGSVAGVPENGEGVLAFSGDAVFALAVNGAEVTVYQSDTDAESMKVAEIFTLDLSPVGTEAVFQGFVNNRNAWFIVKNENGQDAYAVIDCVSREVVKAGLDETKKYGAILNRVYIEREATEEEAKDRTHFVLNWSNILLGTEFSAEIPRDGYDSVSLVSISPEGNYALISAVREDGTEEILCAGKKRCRSLSSFFEGESVEEAFFVYDNILFLNFSGSDGAPRSAALKICY